MARRNNGYTIKCVHGKQEGQLMDIWIKNTKHKISRAKEAISQIRAKWKEWNKKRNFIYIIPFIVIFDELKWIENSKHIIHQERIQEAQVQFQIFLGYLLGNDALSFIISV